MRAVNPLLVPLGMPLFLFCCFVFILGIFNLINIIDGTNAYLNGGNDYCLKIFEQRYDKLPYDADVNLRGDCIYKLDEIQKDYIPIYDLKNPKEYGGE